MGWAVGTVSVHSGTPRISPLSTSSTKLLTSPITNYDARTVQDVA